MTTESTARSIAKATMSLGLVSVPVKLYTTSESADEISFNMLHDADGARLKQQYICTKCNVVVDKEHTIRGYEHAKDTFVVFTTDEIKALDTIDDGQMVIREFIKSSRARSDLHGRGEGLLHGTRRGRRPRLCARARVDGGERTHRDRDVRQEGQGAPGRGPRGRPASHRPRAPVCERSARRHCAVPITACTTKPPLLRIAKQLIARLSSDVFVPERYTDSVQERRHALIKKKIEDGDTITASPKSTPTNIVDMIEALKASIDATPDRSVKKMAPVRDRKSRIKAVAKKRKAS
jgi:DNA end-binding protein Ku